jgi:putative heme-binding domain-containing protein
LWAFDSLYVVVNGNPRTFPSGLYRVRDTNGDDKLDKVELLRAINGGGEHGPHAVLLSPDGKKLLVLAGNHTTLPLLSNSYVPRVWAEDQIIPRMWDARGHARGILAPGGWICEVDPDGKIWTLFCNGFRNEYDAAFNRDGELFTYDSDMEWDMNTPWYRPTRVNHCSSGAEFGWRSGTGKFPDYYPDTLGSVVDVGPGSPTGVVFGYGTRFPAKYQNALYVCDWSYGKLYAVHLTPDGASYKGELEEFISGTPLPLTDIVINPKDGLMYFAVGGRKTTSALYRVTYTGKEPTAPAPADNAGAEARALRRKLEAFHGKKDPDAVKTAWPYLGHEDRYIRFAARIAVEHQDPSQWQEQALAEKDPAASLNALLALTRVGKKEVQPALLKALQRLDWDSLTHDQRLALTRVYGLAFMRMGKPDDETGKKVAGRFLPHYPAKTRELNSELSKLLVYLQAPEAAPRTMELLNKAPTQEEQLDYALALRNLRAGWTPELREKYFRWFLKAAHYHGGASFDGFVANIKFDAITTLSRAERAALQPILEAKPPEEKVVFPPRAFVKKWTVDEAVGLLEKGLRGRDFDRGRQLFGETTCFACHRFANEGGATGPDLTGIAGRFSPKDLVESIIEPSKAVSDQYQAVVIETSDGQTVVGRIVNLHNDGMSVMTNMLDPNSLKVVKRQQIESMTPSPDSLMPKALLDTLKEDELLDLMAFLLSRGNRNDPMFTK